MPGSDTEFKSALLEKLTASVTTQLSALKTEAVGIQNSANEETRSSAGDKYETGRAMAHLELEKLSAQIGEKERMLSQLARIVVHPRTQAETGALVETSVGDFFISVQAAEITLDGRKVIPVSPASPLCKLMIGKPAGYSFKLNGRDITIIRVY